MCRFIGGIACFFGFVVAACAYDFTWFTSFPTNSTVSAIAREPKNRSVVAGTFAGTAILGTNQFTSVGDSDLFIAGLDQNGNVSWAKRAGGIMGETVANAAFGWDGSIFVSGTFSGTAAFGTNVITALSSNGSPDLYLARLSSTGEFLWVRTYAAESSATISAMNVAPNADRVWITGNTLGSLFARSYDFNGNIVRHLTPTTSQSSGDGIAVDTNGNAYITGSFTTSLNFGSTNLTGSAAGNAFVAKFDAVGALVWAAAYSPNNRSAGFDVALTPNGDVVSVGNLDATYLGSPAPTLFVWKLSGNGQELWVRQLGERRSVYVANAVAVDAHGTIYTFGKKSDPFSNFDPRSGPMLTAWTSNGTEAVLLRITGSQTGQDGTGSGIAVDADGNAWLAGAIQGTFDFGTNHVTTPNTVGLVTKLTSVMQPRLAINSGSNANSVIVSWPSAAIGFQLRTADRFPANWSNVGLFPTVVSNRAHVILSTSNSANYFQLHVP